MSPAHLQLASTAPHAFPSEFAADLYQALSRHPRRISPKYFYDQQGSALFEQICELPEYYPTRTELGLLAAHAGEIAALIGPLPELVEFGAGSLQKVRRLLDALDAPIRYLPIDISREHLLEASATLQRHYPRLQVQPVVADYTQDFQLPPRAADARSRFGFFPGSTIGNLEPEEALRFLQRAARLLSGGALLLGADLVKEPAVLHAAYNDAAGVTAAFNRNLLARANRELDTHFNLDQFTHSAFYNAPLQRIEMHLQSRRRQQVVYRERAFEIAEGETLHTENSYKFTVESLRGLAGRAGFIPGPVWVDAERLFSVHWLFAP